MEMTSNIDRDIGNMDARLSALEADMHEVRTDVRDIRDTLLNVKGGWRVLVAVGALSSAFHGLPDQDRHSLLSDQIAKYPRLMIKRSRR